MTMSRSIRAWGLRFGVLLVGVAISWSALRLTDRYTTEEFPSDTVAVIDGDLYGVASLVRHLGEIPAFANAGEARQAIARFVDYQLIERARLEMSEDPELPLSAWGLVEALVGASSPDSEDIRRYYEENLADFVHPRLVRVAWFRAPLDLDRATQERRIHSLRIQSQLDRDPAAFQRLLSRDRPGVDSGEHAGVACDGRADIQLPPEVVKVACRLRRGRTSSPIETADAIYLVRHVGQISARHRSLSQERKRIKAILAARGRDEARARAIDILREQSVIVIPEPAAQRLVVKNWKGNSGRGAPSVPAKNLGSI